MTKLSPTQLSLRHVRDQGYTAAVVDETDFHLATGTDRCWRLVREVLDELPTAGRRT